MANFTIDDLTKVTSVDDTDELIIETGAAGGYSKVAASDAFKDDIATNVSDISSNTTDIGTNTTDIGNNTSDISTNAGDISTNAGDISTNAGNISTNSSDITDNDSAISNNAGDITNHNSRIDDIEAQQSPLIFYFNTLDTTSTAFWRTNYGSTYYWRGTHVEVKAIYLSHGTADTGGTQPTLDIKNNGLHTINASTMSFPSTDGNWSSESVAISSSGSTILTNGDYISFAYTVGTNGDNADAFVVLVVEAC